MKYFLVEILLSYDGLEWEEHAVIASSSRSMGMKKAQSQDFTHSDSGETQKIYGFNAISKTDYDVLKWYLINIL